MDKYKILKQYFGYDSFRQGQELLIEHILNGEDVLGIMPTGAGKSICYQVPAMLLNGITIVISPLISLMKDQVSALLEAGISAAFLNSSLSQDEYNAVIYDAMAEKYKILYVAPERLVAPSFLQLAEQVKIAMVTVDEAHCVSQWGQDFRPSYMKIVEFVERLSYRPIISAFTATATTEVREDISLILRLYNPFTITTGFDRGNLFFGVEKPKDKFNSLMTIIDRNKNKCGIVYCISRKLVEEVCNRLCLSGISATRYHAGLSDYERKQNQEAFIYDKAQVMVATNAFGMGIDKSNVSFVVHYNMPKNIESYYQEAGRAGRDGEPAECILLYSGQDVRTNNYFIEQSDDNNELSDEIRQAVKEKDRERLKFMTYYCTTANCLREFILKYFGENTANFCGNCSNCNANFETVDVTVEALKIMSCIGRLKQRNCQFGIAMIIGILRGSKSEKITRLNLETLSTYGIAKEISDKRLHEIINFLVENDYLAQSNSEYPVLLLGKRANEVLREKAIVKMKLVTEEVLESKMQKSNKSNSAEIFSIDMDLFGELKALRMGIAREEGVPAYIVFSDASLRDMCVRLPVNSDELLEVSGVGKQKLNKYGNKFISMIISYLSKNKDVEREKTVCEMSVLEYISQNIAEINVSKDVLSLSQFADYILNKLQISADNKVFTSSVRAYLISNGYFDEQGENVTNKGYEIGIETEEGLRKDGVSYVSIKYNSICQQFILDRIDEIKQQTNDIKSINI